MKRVIVLFLIILFSSSSSALASVPFGGGAYFIGKTKTEVLQQIPEVKERNVDNRYALYREIFQNNIHVGEIFEIQDNIVVSYVYTAEHPDFNSMMNGVRIFYNIFSKGMGEPIFLSDSDMYIWPRDKGSVTLSHKGNALAVMFLLGK